MLVPSDSLRSYLERSSREYHDQLDKDVSEYLAGRGIDEETAERFRLGVVRDPAPGHENYTGWLSIPYLTPSGSVTSIRFRNLSGSGPKYLNAPGDTPRIYNTAALERGTRNICVTEGELDCVIADKAGLPAVGIAGVENWKPVFALLLEQYDAVYVLSDVDENEAGAKLPAAIAKDLSNVRDVPMTGGDVTDFYLANGAEALRKKVGAK